MMRETAHMPGDFRVVLEALSQRDAYLPELSGRCRRKIAEDREHDSVEDGNAAQKPPGQIKLGAGDFAAQSGRCCIDLAVKPFTDSIDFAVKLCPDNINILPDQIDIFPDQFEVGFCGNPACNTGVDGQRDGFGLFLFDACIAKALNFGDCVERCFGHVRSLLILPPDIDHSRPDCQHVRKCGVGNGGTSFTFGSVGKLPFDPVRNPPLVTASGVAR